MKFICSREDLNNAISIVSRVVPAKGSNLVTGGILLRVKDRVLLSGYNMETGITSRVSAEILEEGGCVMPNPLFGEIVRKLPSDEDVTLEMDKDFNVEITAGIAHFTIKALDDFEFPDLPTVSARASLTVTENSLRRMIDGTVFCTAVSDNRPLLKGVLFELEEGTARSVALDGFRIAVRSEPLEGDLPQDEELRRFVVSSAGLREIQKLLKDEEEPVTLQYDNKRLMFSLGGTEVVCRILEGKYLDYRSAVPSERSVNLCVNTAALRNCVERLHLMVEDAAQNALRLNFGDGSVEMNTATVRGRAKDTCSYAGNGKGIYMGMNSRYLLEALKAVEDGEVMIGLDNAGSPMTLYPADPSDSSFLYLILPVRLSA